jgi:hypothetical protein
MTPWPEFKELPVEAFARSSGRMTVIDCWRITPPSITEVADVVYLGRGTSQGASVNA